MFTPNYKTTTKQRLKIFRRHAIEIYKMFKNLVFISVVFIS